MSSCVICNGEASQQRLNTSDNIKVECPFCGTFIISGTAMEDKIIEEIPLQDRLLFSGYLRQNSSGNTPKLLSNDIVRIPSIVAPYKKLTIIEKINNIIMFIGKNSKHLNERVLIKKTDYTRFFCLSADELFSMLDYLRERNFVIGERGADQQRAFLTVDGWEKYEKLKEINVLSKKAFVAMNFAPEHDPTYDVIVASCDDCGFKANRVDRSEHNEKICDRIAHEIKQSRFIIADFSGQRPGVYYEAGYAQGLGLPVIWTCKKDEVESNQLHFDTRQYNFIAWETVEDLKKRLFDRIKATI